MSQADSKTKDLQSVFDLADFNDRIVGAYNEGWGPEGLPADLTTARSLVAPGTGAFRDFSYIAPDIPEFVREGGTGCMECVTECPDTAILGKVVPENELNARLEKIDDSQERERLRNQFAETTKYYNMPKKKGKEPGLFGIFIDPTKCKGCAECEVVCGDKNALTMIRKDENILDGSRRAFDFFKELPPTPKDYIMEKVLADMMLAEESLLFVGGAGSCMGCGEVTALRMMLAATGFKYGKENIGLVAATGCNSVYGATYPYNPYLVPWSNSLFENVATYGMGVRARWNQLGWHDKKLWAIGGDGAILDIGFQALSRLLASGMNVNVIVLDTQVYSNTGGQSSTATFCAQDTTMSHHGKQIFGKQERRKEIGQIAMMHPDVYVAQTTAAHTNHFYKAIMAANEFDGPAVINVYTTCQPEHGVGDSESANQAKLAVETRTFPLFIHDPRNGDTLKERLDLKGNPAVKEDWYVHPKTKETVDFITFARSEGRFAKQFDKEGKPSKALLKGNEDRLKNWRQLQELAGVL